MKEIKIAIVGCEESKWTNSQRVDAKEEIESIIFKHCHRDFERTHKQCSEEKMIIVSGHCPKGGVDIWAEEIADELGIKKEIYPAEVNQWNDEIGHTSISIRQSHLKKGYRSRNIQIAEAIPMPPNGVLYCIVPLRPIPKLLIRLCDVPFEPALLGKDRKPHILPKDSWCRHHEDGHDGLGHPNNGGCWTMKYAKGLGKETHLVVIE